MAIPLNTFKTTTLDLTTASQTVYTAPTGVTTVVLLAQVSNSNATSSITVSANHVRSPNTTSIIKNTIIPINDAASLLTGKLILHRHLEQISLRQFVMLAHVDIVF